MNKLISTTVILIILAIMTTLGDSVAGLVHGKGDFLTLLTNSALGMVLLIAMAWFAYLITALPGFNKLPVIFWVSIIAAVSCSPLFPYGQQVYQLTSYISIAMLSTVVLTFAGLALGKDIDQFKSISWKIIPVSLAVFSGTFIFAALIAEVTLHWSGTI